MKILYIAGESANWVINLCNKICEKGHEVTCIVQELDEYDKDNPIPTHKNLIRVNVPYEKMFNPDYMVEFLRAYILKYKYDIMFGSHTPISLIIKSLNDIFEIPWGIMILDIPTHLMKENRKRMINWLLWFDIMKLANQIVFNTNIARDEYCNYTKQWFPDENIITYGINMPPEYDLAGLDIRGNYITSVCRLTPVKNCSIIPEALKYINQPKRYIAIGRSGASIELDKIKLLCKNYGIEFEHHEIVTEKEKFEIIKNSSILIYPQATEYIGGLSPYEAMYCGKPVIVRDYKVLKDLYRNNVFYFDGEPINLASVISFVYNIKPNEIKPKLEQANKYTKNMASFDKMAEGLIRIFEKIKGEKQ